MVDDEAGFSSICHGEMHLVHLVSQFAKMLAVVPVILLVSFSLLWVHVHQRASYVGSDGLCVFHAHPGVWIGVSAWRFGQVDSCGSVNELRPWSILLEFFRPCFFKPDFAYFEIECAVGQLDHLLGCWFVSLGIASCGYHHVDVYIVSCDLLDEVSVGLYRNGNGRLARVVRLFLAIVATGQ